MRFAIRLITICLLGFAASQFHAGAAQACIKFDHDAEIALIVQAIAAPSTPAADKEELKAAYDTPDAGEQDGQR